MLAGKADSFDPLPQPEEALPVDLDLYRKVWGEAERLRASDELLKQGTRIRCAVVALHGDYDPHPSAGVAEPLARVLADFRFVLLRRCGHTPWIERHAREEFFAVLRRELPC